MVSYNEVDGMVEAYWLLILVGDAPSDKRKIIRSCMVLAWGGMTEGMIHLHAFLGSDVALGEVIIW